jgi:hypothetical protein
MLDTYAYMNELDTRRLSRVLELSDIRTNFATRNFSGRTTLASKAVVVLSYAHWEGFFNECAETYVKFLKLGAGRVRDVEWNMLLGVLQADFQRLADRNHSYDALFKFLDSLKERLECSFDEFDTSVISARSNLDFSRLQQIFRTLKFDTSKFQPYRLRIDRELCSWRHQVAHGSNPDLSQMDIRSHVRFTETLLATLSDTFQSEINDRFT